MYEGTVYLTFLSPFPTGRKAILYLYTAVSPDNRKTRQLDYSSPGRLKIVYL